MTLGKFKHFLIPPTAFVTLRPYALVSHFDLYPLPSLATYCRCMTSFVTVPFLTFVVNLSVSVNVGFSDHLVDFLVGQLLAQVGHHVTQFGGGNETVPVLKYVKLYWLNHRPL